MEKSMRERLKLSFMGDEDIEYIESLENQVDRLAKKLAVIADYSLCKEDCCPIKNGNPDECNCKCFDPEVWKEWAKKDE